MNKGIKKLITLVLILSLCLTPVVTYKTKAKSNDTFKVKSLYFNAHYEHGNVTQLTPRYDTVHIAGAFFNKKIKQKNATMYKFEYYDGPLVKPSGMHLAVKSVHLTGYKNNKPLKNGEWVDEKYIKKGTLVYKYRKTGKIKKPKVTFCHRNDETLRPCAYIKGIKNNAYVLGGIYKIKPVYFKNTTGKGTSVVTTKIFPFRALKETPKGAIPSNFEMFRYFRGECKSVRSLVYCLKLTCLDIKVSKGIPKIVRKKYTYFGKSTVHKKAPGKCAKDKLATIYNSGTSVLIE